MPHWTDFITHKPGQFKRYKRWTSKQLTKEVQGEKIASVEVIGGASTIVFASGTCLSLVPGGNNIEIRITNPL